MCRAYPNTGFHFSQLHQDTIQQPRLREQGCKGVRLNRSITLSLKPMLQITISPWSALQSALPQGCSTSFTPNNNLTCSAIEGVTRAHRLALFSTFYKFIESIISFLPLCFSVDAPLAL